MVGDRPKGAFLRRYPSKGASSRTVATAGGLTLIRTVRLIIVMILLGLSTLAGGDPFGGRDSLWYLYFETDPRLRELYGTRDIPVGDRERCRETRRLFSEIGGVEPAVEGPGGEGTCPGNVIARLEGSAPGAIIVSAHLDRAGEGEGAIDDFSGVVMLGMLYSYFRDRPHRHDLVFIAFDGEETGLTGSRRFIESSRNMPADVIAVVNLECLGAAFAHSWEEGSSESLEEMFIKAGKLNRIDSGPVSIGGVQADSLSFLAAGYPAITIHGIHPEDVSLLGTAWDRRSAVRIELFDGTFFVLVEFISALDALTDIPNPRNDTEIMKGESAFGRREEKY